MKKLYLILALVLIFSILLSACGGKRTEENPLDAALKASDFTNVKMTITTSWEGVTWLQVLEREGSIILYNEWNITTGTPFITVRDSYFEIQDGKFYYYNRYLYGN